MPLQTNHRIFFISLTGFVMLANWQTLMAEEHLRRLFTSQAHRSELNQLRQIEPQAIADKNVASDKNNHPLAQERPSSIVMQGFVKRTDGKKSTVWVNHQAVQENASLNNIEIGKLSKHSNQVPIKLANNGKNISLKPGQMYDPADNSMREISAAVHGEESHFDMIDK